MDVVTKGEYQTMPSVDELLERLISKILASAKADAYVFDTDDSRSKIIHVYEWRELVQANRGSVLGAANLVEEVTRLHPALKIVGGDGEHISIQVSRPKDAV